MKTLKYFLCLFFLVQLFSCDESTNLSYFDNLSTIVDSKLYEKTTGDDFTILTAVIKDGFLEIQLSASGCDGSTWKARLIDSGLVAESFPVQRYAKIEFVNQELCTAVASKTFAFDLSLLQATGENRVALHLEGWNKELLYSY